MEARILEGRISFDITDLIASVSQEQRLDIIQALACHDQIIDEVTNQIVDGFTSEGWRGGRLISAHAEVYCGLDKACRRIAEASSDIAAKEIAALTAALGRAEKELQEARERAADRSRNLGAW